MKRKLHMKTPASLLVLGILLLQHYAASAQQVDATYLNPTAIDTPYRFIRFGTSTEYYAGFMYNISSPTYGNGDNFSIFTYDSRDMVLRTGNGNVIINHSGSGKLGVGISSNLKGKVHILDSRSIGIPANLDYSSLLVDNGARKLGIDGNQLVSSDELYIQTASAREITFLTDNTERMRIHGSTGYVGVGTTSPVSILDIRATSGDAILRLESDANNGVLTEADNPRIEMYQDGRIIYSKIGFNEDVDTGSNIFQFALGAGATSHPHALTINPNTGNVGIGILQSTERLSVNGTIRAKEIRVEASPWPDFVFEEGYSLPNLTETEEFIKENKHLPGVPSAAEVAEEGIKLAEMNAILLQKIEELTLHIIKQQKQLEAQQYRIEQLEKK